MISISPGGVDRLGVDIAPAPPPPRPAGGRKRGVLSGLIVLLVLAISVTSIVGVIDSTAKQRRQARTEQDVRDARVTLQALIDAESAVRGYVLTGQPSYLPTYYTCIGALRTTSRPIIASLDAIGLAAFPGEAKPFSTRIELEGRLWEDVMAAVQTGPPDAAANMLWQRKDGVVMDTLRTGIMQITDAWLADCQRRRMALDREQDLLLIGNATGAVVTILVLIATLIRGARETAQRELAMAEALHSRAQAVAGREEVRQIFAMAEALQSATSMADGAAILRSSAMRLMQGFGGALYVFNNTRDRLDLALAWDAADIAADHVPVFAPGFLVPGECWALKRNRPHLNGTGPGALRCPHAPNGAASLEVPMVGRGESVGVLVFTASQADGGDRLLRCSDTASVLADSMSLALSSIMLREKLRNQAVRDGLTGLYNRRFLEEVLQKFCLQAQRRRSSLSAIMVDLDHFKRLNDEHGHGMGDTVLKAAAAVIIGALRSSDVACRYGGEELVVLMPDCTIEMASAKAEQIRDRIHRLSRENGPQVSASLGVSAMPSSARSSEELLSTADTAMYQAKQQGRNRVVVAPALAVPASEAPGRGLHDWQGAISLPPLEGSALLPPPVLHDRRVRAADSEA